MEDKEGAEPKRDCRWVSLLANSKSLQKRYNTTQFVNAYYKILLAFIHIRKPIDKTYDRIYGINQVDAGLPSVTHQERFQASADTHDWDWRGFPPRTAFWRNYVIISVIWKSYCVFKTLLWNQITPLVKQLSGWPGHCVVLGRVVLSLPALAPQFAFGVPTNILCWNLVQFVIPQSYLLPTVVFMMQSERDLRHFYKLMEANKECYLMTATARVPTVAIESQRKGSKFVLIPKSMSVHEEFYRDIMCFKVRIGPRIFYRLRPNRTIEAHQALNGKLVASFIGITKCICLFTTSLGVLIIIALISDLRYVQNHAGCDPYMDELYESGKISGLLGTTLTRPHRIAVLIADVIENHFVWGEFFLIVMYPTGLAYILDTDLFTYWQSLHSRIETIAANIRSHNDYQYRSQAYLFEEQEARKRAGLQVDAQLDEMYHELIDFFCQFELTDKLVGDMVTAVVLAFLNWVFTGTIWFANHPEYSELSTHLIVTQLWGVLVVAVPAHLMLRMHRCCIQTHNLICSLNANIEPGPTRRKLLRVFEFYQGERNLTGYRLFRKYTITTTTFLTIFGWAISTVTICWMFFGRDAGVDQAIIVEDSSESNDTSLLKLGTVSYSLI